MQLEFERQANAITQAKEHIDRYWDDDHHPATSCEICHTYYTLKRLAGGDDDG